ncbi:hypothetical protein ACHHYP_00420 [Achlya hypogyna]|uniref:Chromatin target of PRMT1 protein C-terminal domain-containing protein n=1 Tax=Achlya hypogyna TaxID=1202772 RepID=A0A1V9ZUI6_ACHHY|nr:hypothetical protein ACHHYP_00420 [Achlya hypogyna]
MAGRRNHGRQRKPTPSKDIPRTSDIIGVASVPLSDRFSQLHAQPSKAAPKKKKSVVVVRAAQKAQRADVVNARRGLPPAPQAKTQLKARQTAAMAKPSLSKTPGGIKINNMRKKGPPKAPVKKATAPKKDVDLDMEMDDYWFKAGKGPDPKQKRLDESLDEYWANKPTKSEEAP